MITWYETNMIHVYINKEELELVRNKNRIFAPYFDYNTEKHLGCFSLENTSPHSDLRENELSLSKKDIEQLIKTGTVGGSLDEESCRPGNPGYNDHIKFQVVVTNP
tara:strand:+ start:491 stop:808 length:318 start_codon:yes stop_codon:yes gene_type:complete